MQRSVPMILHVEDEENIRKLITVNLIERGYQVVEAFNGQEALDNLRDQTPDLMILNIKLPDISGLDILEHLDDKNIPSSDVPVVLMTATDVDKDQIVSQHPRIVKIFTKPFDVKEVVDFIHEKLPKDRRQ
jgi:two-component system, OmpR family, alkaline phosphatase synthesis response regulator PhoP